MGKITDLLHEFWTIFFEMKGIVGDLGEMKIPLRPDAKLVRKQPYQLNPHYKEKFKVELDRMLEA